MTGKNRIIISGILILSGILMWLILNTLQRVQVTEGVKFLSGLLTGSGLGLLIFAIFKPSDRQ